jgi:hypothetical protein
MYTMGNDSRGGEIMYRGGFEEEWWSVCCSAPPLYGVEELDDIMDTIGVCMNCKEHVSFELTEEEK